MTTRALTITDTTLGMKYVMAVSGIVWFGYAIAHMLGNLQIFLGPAVINDYSKMLHEMPALLWTARVVMLVSIVAHIATALRLTALNQSARGPEGYRQKKMVASNYAAMTMRYGGPALALYILYHLAHLTFGWTQGLGYEAQSGDVYGALVASFQVPWCVAIYVVASALLGMHLYHGAWSMFQSLGLNHKRYNEALRSTASAVALAVAAGFMAVPIAVITGFVR
jgi:succinate dehydrogenase / fumarate reductase cytochrome b subunit